MPYLKIQTNRPVPDILSRKILERSSKLIASELGKPEEFVMLALEPSVKMLFAGNDDPVAFLELKSIGLPGQKTKQLSQRLCELIEEELGIAKERVYVKFIDVQRGMWGWNGGVF
jgi:phenylpyruvate tautomerase PptA (4-oxalocrotonate tautomerase family)